MLQRIRSTDTIARALHGTAATRAIEREALAALPPFTLMSRAGAAVARLARAVAPHAGRVWIASGPGNNGGDGLEAAVLLHQAGLAVTVCLGGDPARLPADALQAWSRACAAGVAIVTDSAARPGLQAQDIAIDAVLGLGANRPPEGRTAALIGSLADLPCRLLSIDLPSGLDSDTGRAHGGSCVQATHTLSLLTLKPGLFTNEGRDLTGELWFDDLDIGPPGIAPSARLSPAPTGLRPRQHAQHKGSFGDVAVVGGASGMAGAALLAARAAHAAGAGRVYVDLLDPAAPALDPDRPELMIRRGWARDSGDALHGTTVVAGCGGGQAVRAVLPRLLSGAARLVLDADALNAVATDASLQQLLIARRARGLESVLTPHPLEAARLLGLDTAGVQADRLTAAQWLAERFGTVVVLKGSGSVIAAPDTVASINPTGNAALATAGTGDVLAGWMGGHWSAHGGGGLDAALCSTWWHGRAAEAAPDGPLRAADLVEVMHGLRGRAP